MNSIHAPLFKNEDYKYLRYVTDHSCYNRLCSGVPVYGSCKYVHSPLSPYHIDSILSIGRALFIQM